MFHVRQAIALQKNDFAPAQHGERYSRNLMDQHLVSDKGINLPFRRAIIPRLTKAGSRDD